MVINDDAHKNVLNEITGIKQNISSVLNDLWPKLGFLPIDKTNPGTALIAEFFLNEMIFKDPGSTDLENLELGQIKNLFDNSVKSLS